MEIPATVTQIENYAFHRCHQITIPDGVTEIAVPTRLYPGGVEVTIVGVDGCWALDEARERAVIRVLGAGEVTVMIGPATK